MHTYIYTYIHTYIHTYIEAELIEAQHFADIELNKIAE